MTNHRNNSETMNSVKNNATKVTCPECGAEFALEGAVSNPRPDAMDFEQKAMLLRSMGFDMDGFMKIAESLGMRLDSPSAGKGGAEEAYTPEEEAIGRRDWVSNARLWRRFLPARTLDFLFGSYSDTAWGRTERKDGDHFTKALHERRYGYEWKVLCNELNAACKMQKHGDEANLETRAAIWARQSLVVGMMQEYRENLREMISKLPVRRHWNSEKCADELYCKLPGARNFVVLDEFEERLFEPIGQSIRLVLELDPEASDYLVSLLGIVKAFAGRLVKLPKRYHESRAFNDAYKAAGGYYTLEDFIRFNGWRIRKRESRYGHGEVLRVMTLEESLAFVRQRLEESLADGEGYRMLGIVKEAAADNGFDYAAAREQWHAERMGR